METTSFTLKASFLAALGHENRIRILEFLQSGEKCNCEIYPALQIEQSNLSRHMKILVEAGIVKYRKDGLRIYYRLADERVLTILETAAEIIKDRIRDNAQLLAAL